MMGKPVITGTRPVELILEKFAAGETIEQLLEAYPRLTISEQNKRHESHCRRKCRQTYTNLGEGGTNGWLIAILL